MRRTIVLCVLLSQILAAQSWRSDSGIFTCQSYSHPLFYSTPWSWRQPCYSPAPPSSCGVRVKPILNLLIDDPPSKSSPDLSDVIDSCKTYEYTPDPFEVTEKTSKILHKLHTVVEDFAHITEGYLTIYTNVDESSEEELPGYDDDGEGLCNNYKIDIRDSEDDSCEEENTSDDHDDCNDDSNEECDDGSVLDIEIRIRSKM